MSAPPTATGRTTQPGNGRERDIGECKSWMTRVRTAPGFPDERTSKMQRRHTFTLGLVLSVAASVGIASPALGTVASRTTSARIVALEAAVKTAPEDGRSWLSLGSAYVRRAFETADPAFYPRADAALVRAEKSLGRSAEVVAAQASLALARHRFRDAQALASSLVAMRPSGLDGRIALFDANIELGQYNDAADEIQTLVEQRPNVATLSRLSYSRQLSGDLRSAEVTMREAASAAPPASFDRAVALGYLGDVLLEGGRLDAASRAYDDALRIDPTVATAVMGAARVSMARGDANGATAELDRLIDRLPLPGALGLRADIARARGDRAGAVAADQLVDASVSLFRANGAVVDAELAVFLADRGPASAADAVRTAKRAFAERQTIFTNDAMAWSLFGNGNAKDAEPYARRAVASSPAVASVRWHAAAVLAAVGDKAGARHELEAALRNPWFSPSQRPAIAALATKLGVALPPNLSNPSSANGATS